jgi:hypothetical protein
MMVCVGFLGKKISDKTENEKCDIEKELVTVIRVSAERNFSTSYLYQR